jgi:hypothetical protein
MKDFTMPNNENEETKKDENQDKIINFYEGARSVDGSDIWDDDDDLFEDEDFDDDEIWDDEDFDDDYFDDDDDFDDDDEWDDVPFGLKEEVQSALMMVLKNNQKFSSVIQNFFDISIFYEQIDEIEDDGELVFYFQIIAINLRRMFDDENILEKKSLKNLNASQKKSIINGIHKLCAPFIHDYFEYKKFMLEMEKRFAKEILKFLPAFIDAVIKTFGIEYFKEDFVNDLNEIDKFFK